MKLMPWEQTHEFADAVKLLKRWDEKGYSSISGPFAVVIDKAPSPLRASNEEWIPFYFDNDYPVRRMPILAESLSYSTYDVNVFSKNSPNIEQALRFMEWMNSSIDNYNLIMYGIKDRNYRMQDGRLLSIIDKGDGYYFSSSFQNITYAQQNAATPEEYKKYYANLIDSSVYAPHTGYIMDPELESSLSKRDYLFYFCITTSEGFGDPNQNICLLRTLISESL